MNFFQYIQQLKPFLFEELEACKNISKRISYCSNNLKQIAKGSSRIVYEINDDVLKLSKNEKGVEQTKNEITISQTGIDIVPNLISFNEQGYWVVFEKLEPVTHEQFESITNMKLSYIHQFLKYTKDRKRKHIPLNFKLEQQIQSSKLISDLCKLITDYNLSVGDIIRISSWGQKNNKVYLLDFGLTSEIYKQYYKK